MKHSLHELESSLDRRLGDVHPQFKMVMIYEDEITRNQALRIYEHLLQRIENICRLETYRWDMKNPEGLEALFEAVTMANIIFVTGRDTSELPVEVQNAVESGLSMKRVEKSALVALLGRASVEDRAPSALHLYLKETAQRTGLDFFPGVFELIERLHAYTIEAIHERAERMTPTLEHILHHPMAHVDYGINE